jgi:hypothetical protein
MFKWLPEYYRLILTLLLLVGLTGLLVVFDESICGTLLGFASVVYFITSLFNLLSPNKEGNSNSSSE